MEIIGKKSTKVKWPHFLGSKNVHTGAEGFVVKGSEGAYEGVYKGVAITVVEDWLIGSILHSRVCSLVKPLKVTPRLGR